MTFVIALTDRNDTDPRTVCILGGYHDRNAADYFAHRANAVLIREGSEDNQLVATVHELVEPTLKAVRAWSLNQGVFSAEPPA